MGGGRIVVALGFREETVVVTCWGRILSSLLTFDVFLWLVWCVPFCSDDIDFIIVVALPVSFGCDLHGLPSSNVLCEVLVPMERVRTRRLLVVDGSFSGGTMTAESLDHLLLTVQKNLGTDSDGISRNRLWMIACKRRRRVRVGGCSAILTIHKDIVIWAPLWKYSRRIAAPKRNLHSTAAKALAGHLCSKAGGQITGMRRRSREERRLASTSSNTWQTRHPPPSPPCNAALSPCTMIRPRKRTGLTERITPKGMSFL